MMKYVLVLIASLFMLVGTASAEIHVNVTDNWGNPLASDDWNLTHVNVYQYQQDYDWTLRQWAWDLKKIIETPTDCGLKNWPPPPTPNGCVDWSGDATLRGQLPKGWYQIEVGARNHRVVRQFVFLWEDNERVDLEVMLPESPLQIFMNDLHVTSLKLPVDIFTISTVWQFQPATLKIEVTSPGKTSFEAVVAGERQDIWVQGWGWDFRTVTFSLPLSFTRAVTYGAQICISITAFSQQDSLTVLGEGKTCGYKRF